MSIDEILLLPPSLAIPMLKRRRTPAPDVEKLKSEYDRTKHPVMNRQLYPDKITSKGIEPVTRITLGWQKLAVNRMCSLLFGLSAKRVYTAETDEEQMAADIMEDLYEKNHIDALNLKRAEQVYSSQESITIWYTQETATLYAGQETNKKIRCKTFYPFDGTRIYPHFDEMDDLTALSWEYSRGAGKDAITYFEVLTADRHLRYSFNAGGTIALELDEAHTLGKIPAIYVGRGEPIWEDLSQNVYEAEWALSRQGNYIRKNSAPNFVVYSDNNIKFSQSVTRVAPDGKTKQVHSADDNNSTKNILRFGKDDRAEFITWQGATDALRYHVEGLKINFFSELRLPDMSAENLKGGNLSGEARKMIFLEAQQKAKDESGIWYEALARECNVLRQMLKARYPRLEKAFETLKVEHIITPYQINDDRETINNLTSATAGRIMSRRTAIQQLGWVRDVDDELAQIQREELNEDFNEPTI